MCIVNTPYDDVFRTLLTDCKKLIIPMVNEIFKEDYTGREQVILKENEIIFLYLRIALRRWQTICEMSEKVLGNIAEKYEKIKKEVREVMGGQILEYEAKNILCQGIEQGIIKSIQKMLAKGYSCNEVSSTLEIDLEEVKKIQEEQLQMV